MDEQIWDDNRIFCPHHEPENRDHDTGELYDPAMCSIDDDTPECAYHKCPYVIWLLINEGKYS